LAEGALDPVIRVYHIADVLDLTATERGSEAAIEEVKKRAGRHFDPDLAATVARDPHGILAVAATTRPFEDFLAAEPEPHVVADRARFDDVALAFAYLTDLKSVYTLGHSTSVARVAETAARALGMTEDDVRLVRRSA